MPTSNLKNLRQQLRQARRNLSLSQQTLASQQLLKQLSSQTYFLTAQHIAIYLPADGEINTQPLIQLAWQLNKQVCLPRLNPLKKGYLDFLRYEPNTQLATNHFGLAEPAFNPSQLIALESLDIIFLPLVGFDAAKNRLGMGGGYYDRSLARLKNSYRKPRLIGLAHSCQQVEQLKPQPWDIPLDKLIIC